MTFEGDVATDLLRRIIAGERGQVPLYLGMLLEKSSPLRGGDDHYRQILPQELADIRLSAEQAAGIIRAICAEVSCNPDHDLIFAISFTGSDEATRTLVSVLINPPRQLSMLEYGAALAVLSSFLPCRLGQDPEFLPKTHLERLAQFAKELHAMDESAADKPDRIRVKLLAGQLLNGLHNVGHRT